MVLYESNNQNLMHLGLELWKKQTKYKETDFKYDEYTFQK